ncbi:MAG: hypothetical protein EB020_15965 [Proteobacteria bacterium]|nr:hypothetical protein [Pseudomonadota bacterium]
MELKQTREGALRLGSAASAAAVAGTLGLFDAREAGAQASELPRGRTLRMVFGGSGGKFNVSNDGRRAPKEHKIQDHSYPDAEVAWAGRIARALNI